MGYFMITLRKKIFSATVIFSALSLFAVDYAKMSTGELMNLRGNIPVEDIEVYGNILSQRVSVMNENDLKKYGIWEMLQGRTSASKVGCSCNLLKQRPQR